MVKVNDSFNGKLKNYNYNSINASTLLACALEKFASFNTHSFTLYTVNFLGESVVKIFLFSKSCAAFKIVSFVNKAE